MTPTQKQTFCPTHWPATYQALIKPKELKPRRDWKGLKEELIQQSSMTISADLKGNVYIKLAGPLARIPSLKNTRAALGALNPETKVRLAAITEMWERLQAHQVWKHKDSKSDSAYGNQPLWISVLVAKECRSDEDNMLASVKELLEPRVHRGRKKPFGMNITDDDRFVNGWIFHPRRVGFGDSNTYIVIQTWKQFWEQSAADLRKAFSFFFE